MMKKFYYLFVLLVGAGFWTACDNGYADIELRDSAPLVELMDLPSAVEPGAAINFTADLKDGVTEEHSLSPLSGYAWSVQDTTTAAEIANGSGAVSGREAVLPLSIPTDGWETGVYELIFSASDTKGLTTTVTGTLIEITDCPEPAARIGIIGNATDAGWGPDDIPMTADPENPYLWSITLDLDVGEVKFRQDNDWAIAWGSTDFPSGIGSTEGGSPNMPISEAGTYYAELNTCSGAYNFIKQ